MGDRIVDSPAPAAEEPPAELRVGWKVRLAGPQRYLKTADPMPMLRPPDLVDCEEWGEVCELRPLRQAAVRFRRGTFLLSADQLCCDRP
ncbi:MAG: NAD(P)H dehydrogenase assembly family protein [Synechococcaceae cyanobacterium]|nr:NAD(P)H dehydrogenase assembly family protein [Synechococcaceae cyanobacterium]